MPIEETATGEREETAAERNARIQAAFNAASASMPTTTPPNVPNLFTLEREGRDPTRFQPTHLDVPYEQFKANIDVVRPWDWLEQSPEALNPELRQASFLHETMLADRQAKQEWQDTVASMGGWMTPGEASGAGWYGPSTMLWTGRPEDIALAKQGISSLAAADRAAVATANYINNFGYPSFITPYVANRFNWDAEQMDKLGYIQDAGGNWVRTARGETTTTYSGGGGGGGAGTIRYGGGGGGRGYAGSSYFGLVNWRIGV